MSGKNNIIKLLKTGLSFLLFFCFTVPVFSQGILGAAGKTLSTSASRIPKTLSKTRPALIPSAKLSTTQKVGVNGAPQSAYAQSRISPAARPPALKYATSLGGEILPKDIINAADYRNFKNKIQTELHNANTPGEMKELNAVIDKMEQAYPGDPFIKLMKSAAKKPVASISRPSANTGSAGAAAPPSGGRDAPPSNSGNPPSKTPPPPAVPPSDAAYEPAPQPTPEQELFELLKDMDSFDQYLTKLPAQNSDGTFDPEKLGWLVALLKAGAGNPADIMRVLESNRGAGLNLAVTLLEREVAPRHVEHIVWTVGGDEKLTARTLQLLDDGLPLEEIAREIRYFARYNARVPGGSSVIYSEPGAAVPESFVLSYADFSNYIAPVRLWADGGVEIIEGMPQRKIFSNALHEHLRFRGVHIDAFEFGAELDDLFNDGVLLRKAAAKYNGIYISSNPAAAEYFGVPESGGEIFLHITMHDVKTDLYPEKASFYLAKEDIPADKITAVHAVLKIAGESTWCKIEYEGRGLFKIIPMR